MHSWRSRAARLVIRTKYTSEGGAEGPHTRCAHTHTACLPRENACARTQNCLTSPHTVQHLTETDDVMGAQQQSALECVLVAAPNLLRPALPVATHSSGVQVTVVCSTQSVILIRNTQPHVPRRMCAAQPCDSAPQRRPHDTTSCSSHTTWIIAIRVQRHPKIRRDQTTSDRTRSHAARPRPGHKSLEGLLL